MQDPERLLDAGTEFERALLRGAVVERPSARTLRRMALGAGVGGALSYTSSAKALLQTWWGKTVAVAVVGGGVAAGVVGSLPHHHRGSPEATSVASSAPAAAPVLPVSPQAVQPAPSPPEPAVEAPAPGEAPAVAPRERASRKSAPLRAASPASTLADEVKQLDRVRGLMGRGDRAAALGELEAYDRRYPQGTLRREARVLRARAVEQQ